MGLPPAPCRAARAIRGDRRHVENCDYHCRRSRRNLSLVADESRGRSIAVAGILATAVVGVAGTAGSWLIARDDRTNQRSLAHDARVYDRRADTYLDALRLIERQKAQLVRELIRSYGACGGCASPAKEAKEPAVLRHGFHHRS
jgi:hypothetical protein